MNTTATAKKGSRADPPLDSRIITDEEYEKAVRARVEKADFLDKYFTCIGETSPLIERLELDMDSMPSFNLTQLSIAHDRAAAIVRWMHEKGVHEKCGLTIWLAYIYAIAHYQGKKEITFRRSEPNE